MRMNRKIRSWLALGALLAGWSQAAGAWWSHDWSYRKQIVLNPAAVPVSGGAALHPAVVLVRLHEGVFRFGDANADGSDLRFVAEDDKTPLAYHIEKFDPVFNMAFVWVALPELKPDVQTRIWMYYGNAQTNTLPESRETYPAEQLLVYHFSDAAGSAAQDATTYAQHAGSVVAGDDSGLIGGAARFDGTALLSIPANAALQMQSGAALSWSLWLRPSAAESATVYSYGNGALRIGLDGGHPSVAVNGRSLLRAPTAIADGSWHHVGVTVSTAGTLSLYLDGKLAGSAPVSLPTLQAGATLGGEGSGGAVQQAYHGTLDEFQIYRGELSAGWMQLAASNQGTQDKLLGFGGDEQQSSSHTSHLGIILSSLTLDAWIAIVVLMTMMSISFVIMARKASQLSRAAKGNAAFLDLLAGAEGDVLTLAGSMHSGETAPASALALQSPLHALFDSGLRELRHRNPQLQPGVSLNPAAIEAIRAAMETVVLRQTQALNKFMVLLTIAISGGPFIGLLGTVMGVMITFASVAAAGDVNINAIAPGIAAALAATVAGLLVAIPSLFGYNYLLSRVKECSADMQVFVQEFTTKVAERFHAV
ncbi:biopolymer transport protein ExbB [Solimonas aquatica]|uniref:Biopolymer transport protein ExbB n=1 Tax=Solimonas aquatica TaxID=489703 RepID=A0A1H9DMV0_9GAMM|nr:DUF2341 domain-containing protein [Solimonas aquatica]SEQ14637.1 biopolymer transport protein ExbB [Solimonas aquatica]